MKSTVKKENFMEKYIKKRCSICNKYYNGETYDLYPCPHCGWYNDRFCEENPTDVVYRNLISFNKAKKLYEEGKGFEPDLNDFMAALHSYGEMQFEYKGVYYAVEFVHDENKKLKIQLYNSKTTEKNFFDNDDDFKNNATIDGHPLKDIWDKTTDRYWLQ